MKDLLMVVLAVSGYGLLIWQVGWKVAIAVFLLQWAHNVERHRHENV